MVSLKELNKKNENLYLLIDQVRVAGSADVSWLARTTFASETVTESRTRGTKWSPDPIAGSASSNARSRGPKAALIRATSPVTPVHVIRARNANFDFVRMVLNLCYARSSRWYARLLKIFV